MKTRDETHDKGLRIRKEVMGTANVEARLKASTEFMQPLQTMISQWAYGEIWARDELPRKIRSMLVLAMMAALNRPHELRVHVIGALNNGCSKDEIREVLLQVAIYCGIPASLDAHLVAQDVFKELGV
jgi:4-carboxymuconolactone decarboxylase